MLRLTGSFRVRANSMTLRTPDNSMECIRSAIQRFCMSCSWEAASGLDVVRENIVPDLIDGLHRLFDRDRGIPIAVLTHQLQPLKFRERVVDLEIDLEVQFLFQVKF